MTITIQLKAHSHIVDMPGFALIRAGVIVDLDKEV